MNFEFNNAVTMKTLPTNVIRFKTMEKLEEVSKSLKQEAEELKRKFNSLIDDEDELEEEPKEADFLDSIIVDFAILGPLSSFLAGNFAIFKAVNLGLVMSFANAVDEARKRPEDELEGKLFDYPFGRVQFALGQNIEEVEEDFNTVSRKMTLGSGATPRAQKNRMYEVLSMLDKLEKQGLNYIDVSEKGSLYDNIKKVADDFKGYQSLFSSGKKDYAMSLAVA